MLRMETIVCPQCNKQASIRLWESIDATVDTTAKAQLLDGSLFTYRCKKCGYTADIAFNCMYKDPSKSLTIYLAADGDVEGMKAAMADVDATVDQVSAGLKIKRIRRVVSDVHSLREKVIIFENGLDDRVIELMKIFYFNIVHEREPELEINHILFYIADGHPHFEFITQDKHFAVAIQDGIYGEFEKEYHDKLNATLDEYVVDIDFAVRMIEAE